MENVERNHPLIKKSLLFQLIKNRAMALKLARNDIKARFSGSLFGLFWAFVQPAISIAVYCFVFMVGFKAGTANRGVPYVLWLVSGIVAWLFFTEAWVGGSNSLIEYSYLVKKIVFPIEVLPCSKVISSLFIHVIFLMLVAVLFILMRVPFGASIVQLPYYVLCLISYTIGASYLFAAIMPFFRDAAQIVQIFCQIGFWLTPIAWDAQSTIKSALVFSILRANPMYYIVEGYRTSFIGGAWFFEDMSYTIYFWTVTALMFALSGALFSRMRPHFADSL